MPPLAALGVIAYGLPATPAVAAAPVLVSTTLEIVSPFCRPVAVNAVGDSAACHYVGFAGWSVFVGLTRQRMLEIEEPFVGLTRQSYPHSIQLNQRGCTQSSS